MFNLPLPKKLRSSSVLLPIIIAVLILVVVIEIGLFFTSQNEDVLKERQKDIGVQQYNKLAQEVNNQQEELKNKRPPLIEKCLWVSPKDPNTGIYRLDFIKEKVYDYLYEGKLVKVGEKDEGGCPYIYLVLLKGEEFTITIPTGLLGKTDFGETSALIYKNHLGQKVQLRVRYEHNAVNPKTLQIQEWQPEAFFLN